MIRRRERRREDREYQLDNLNNLQLQSSMRKFGKEEES